MNKESIISKVELLVQNEFMGEASGHDWYHIQRVRNLALNIASKEGGDLFVIQLGALLHDIADWKFFDGNDDIGPKRAEEILLGLQVSKVYIITVQNIIRQVSFKGAQVETKPSFIEAQIVQDADRIDAMGAMGIARAFAYGGSTGQAIYDPDLKAVLHTSFEDYKNSKTSSINHFYEKLLLLRDRITTQTGKEIAAKRHSYMEEFLKQFMLEWNI